VAAGASDSETFETYTKRGCRSSVLVGVLSAALLAAACSDPEGRLQGASPDPAPPTARLDIVEELKKDLEATRHPSDGGGSARLDADDETSSTATVSTPGRWAIRYEAGPLGVAEGGAVFLQVPPFWGWSTPQIEDERAPGFTEVTTDAVGVTLLPRTLGPQLLGIDVTGRPLLAGERIRIVYGAGSSGAIADRYAEHGSRFWVAVDGDGDGVRALVPDSPAVDVEPGPPSQLHLTLPTTARPGDTVRLTVAVLDPAGNAGCGVAGDVAFVDPPVGLDLPEHVTLEPGDAGHKTVTVIVREPGIYRLQGKGPGDLSAESNPLEVSTSGPRILWGDLHGHSNFSDGTGLPRDYFRYARDVAALDVVALTDHDHWGMQFIDSHPKLWEEIRAQTRLFHEPGRFVTLLGYEWTSWIHGHRHVLYFSDEGEVHSSLDPKTDTPALLWKALSGQNALTFAHHSAGGPIPVNWSYAPDPLLEPVTEVVSVHGSSEAMDSPGRIYNPVPGNFVRDALDRGYRLGFVGSGDSHDGHPGNAHLAAATGGLAAILSEELTRTGVREALLARRVYATSGPRILLRVAVDGTRMGGVLRSEGSKGPHDLALRVVGTAPLGRVDVIQSGTVIDQIPGDGSRELSVARPLTGLAPGAYVYVRVVQEDGGLAWSSPIFVD
jgi:hypothetical protein